MNEECEHNRPFWECEICGNVRSENKNRKKEKDVSVWIAEGKEQEFREQMLKKYPDKWYRCASCGEIYERGTPEDEMIAEYKENFPDDPDMLVPRAIICDDCYQPDIEEVKEEIQFDKDLENLTKRFDEESIKEPFIPGIIRTYTILESFEELQQFIKERYPEYNDFYCQFDIKPFGKVGRYNRFCYFDTMVTLSKEEELLTEKAIIEVDGISVKVSYKNGNMELIALCVGKNSNKVIPVLKVGE